VRRAERLLFEAPERKAYRHKLARTEADDVQELLDRHGRGIVAGAKKMLRTLDPIALETAPVHVVSFDTLRLRNNILAGFILARGSFSTFQSRLPPAARPGPVVAVNLRGIVTGAVREMPADATEEEIVADAAQLVRLVALHEYAHVVESAAAVQPFDAPCIGSSAERLEAVALAIATPPPMAVNIANHPAPWVRALFHAWRRSPEREAQRWLWNQIGNYFSGEPGHLVEALHDDPSDGREPIVDILRRPAPDRFTTLTTDRFRAQEARA
ncbi:MAG: hypothetical protein RLZZ326_3655, partial [Planctomycetota bacterium]